MKNPMKQKFAFLMIITPLILAIYYNLDCFYSKIKMKFYNCYFMLLNIFHICLYHKIININGTADIAKILAELNKKEVSDEELLKQIYAKNAALQKMGESDEDEEKAPNVPPTRFEAIIIAVGLIAAAFYALLGNVDLDFEAPSIIINADSTYKREYPPWDKYQIFKEQPNNFYYEKNLKNEEYLNLCLDFYKLDANDFAAKLGIDEKTQRKWKRMFILFRLISPAKMSLIYEIWRDHLYQNYPSHYTFCKKYSSLIITYVEQTRVSPRNRKKYLTELHGMLYTNRKSVKVHELYLRLWKAKRIDRGRHSQLQAFLYFSSKSKHSYKKFSRLINYKYPGMLANIEKKFSKNTIIYGLSTHFTTRYNGTTKTHTLISTGRRNKLINQVNIIMYDVIQTAKLTPAEWRQLTTYSEEFIIYALLLERKYPKPIKK